MEFLPASAPRRSCGETEAETRASESERERGRERERECERAEEGGIDWEGGHVRARAGDYPNSLTVPKSKPTSLELQANRSSSHRRQWEFGGRNHSINWKQKNVFAVREDTSRPNDNANRGCARRKRSNHDNAPAMAVQNRMHCNMPGKQKTS